MYHSYGGKARVFYVAKRRTKDKCKTDPSGELLEGCPCRGGPYLSDYQQRRCYSFQNCSRCELVRRADHQRIVPRRKVVVFDCRSFICKHGESRNRNPDFSFCAESFGCRMSQIFHRVQKMASGRNTMSDICISERISKCRHRHVS